MRQRRFHGVRGLTLVEILIAIVIVSVGIIGILALVTATLKSSGVIIESSFASTIGRSVYESLRMGARQRSFIVPQGTKYYRGFCFVHDGVLDTISGTPTFAPPIAPQPANPDATLWDGLLRSDFAVFLPSAPPTGGTGGGNGEKIFVYPRPTASKADGTVDDTQTKAENQGETDDSFTTPHAGYGGNSVVYDIRRIYNLRNRPASGATATGVTPTLAQGDAADQYGFAFTVRRAVAPLLYDPATNAGQPFMASNGALDKAMYPPGAQVGGVTDPTRVVYVDGLYQVEVMVFRNFEQFAKSGAGSDPHEMQRTHEPVGRFIGLIAIGG